MELNNFQFKHLEWQKRFDNELSKAPNEFKQAWSYFCDGDIATAEKSLAMCALAGLWPGTASSILAFFELEKKNYYRAIELALAGENYGLEFPGYWYYYKSLASSYNFIDELDKCIRVINEAIDFFTVEDSPSDLSGFYFHKSNVFKQVAGPLSHNIDGKSQSDAKECIKTAIECLCKSLAIISDGWESDVKPELEGIARIAARVGIRRNDLPFLEEMLEIKEITNQYFSDSHLVELCVIVSFNEANNNVETGNRVDADLWFRRALELAPEEKKDDIAFKGIVYYLTGVNLLRLHNLKGSNFYQMDESTINIRRDIKSLWNQSVRLYNSLDPGFVADFDKRMPPGLTESVWNIKRDPIMNLM